MGIKKLIEQFKKPCIIGLCGDANTGKSNAIYHFLNEVEKDYSFKLYTYGLKYNMGKKIYSVEELEQITNSVIVLDEFFSLFDLDDNKKRKLIERTIRLIYHNNNVLVLCGLPDNFKKFISQCLNVIIFMKCSISSFINGSRIKKICLSYKGDELGSSVLNLQKNEAILFDGLHYYKLNIPYMKKYDSKRRNKDIIQKNPKKNAKNILKKCKKN